MLTVSATRTIDAPRAAVFAFLDEPANQVRVSPSVTGVADVQPKPDGGKRLLYGYRVFGIVFTGSLETTTYDPPERIVFRMDGDVRGEITWELEALDADTTRFTYGAEYDISGFPGSSLLRPIFRWYNDRELRKTVANVQRAVEAGTTDREDFERFGDPAVEDHAVDGAAGRSSGSDTADAATPTDATDTPTDATDTSGDGSTTVE